MKIRSLLSLILILTSCAFHSGTLTSNVTAEPVVHKDIAVGVASTNRVLQIGGLSKDALISEARKNMVRSRPLEGAEQYNNIEVNFKNTFYILGHKTKVTITADVIEPKDSVNQPSYSERYLKKLTNPGPQIDLFAVGDSITLNNYNYQKGEIVRFLGEDFHRVEISYTDAKNNVKTKKVSINQIYVSKPDYNGVKRLSRTPYGVVVGFGMKKVLIKMADGHTTMNYPKSNE